MNGEGVNKSLGQHWLRDESVLRRIAQYLELEKSDTVLEIGPGRGALTRHLVGEAATVVAVELDDELAKTLPKTLNANNLRLVHGDILDFDTTQLPEGYKVAGNIPYYLTSHLVRRLLEAQHAAERIVLLMQQEVAQRIVAPPGRMSVLSVAAQHYADCELGIVVPPEAFSPPPKVNSQVVILRPKDSIADVDEQQFFRIVKAGFGERRKKLTNSLAGGLQLEKQEVANILDECGLSPMARAQELSLQQWYDVYGKVVHG